MRSNSRLPLDFKETVGQNEAKKEEFCDSQKDQVQKFAQICNDQNQYEVATTPFFQIAQLLDTDSRNLRNCSVREGSVIVAMGVEGYDEVEAAELEKATQDLQQMIADGQVGEIRMDVTFGRELQLLRLHRRVGVGPKYSSQTRS